MKLLILLSALALAASATVLDVSGHQLAKGRRCNADPTACAAGLSCVGNPGNKKCFRKRTANEKCGKDPFWVCEDGLSCSRVGRCASTTGVRKSCNSPGDSCAPGLVCVGNLGNKRCFPPRLMGDKCGKDPFWVCQAPLACSPLGMCVRPRARKKSCNAPGDVCRSGLVCVGNVGNKRCFKPMREGDRCGKDPFWVCVDGLTCSAVGRCIKGVDAAGSCNSPGDCAAGLSCVGNPGNMKCFPPRLLGDKCGKDPFWDCAPGLFCVMEMCRAVPAITTAGECNTPSAICEEGLVCVGNPGNKKCFPPRLEGDKCGKDPFWECQAPFSCVNEVCE